MKKYSKTKTGEQLGFRTPDHLRAKRLGGIKPVSPKYNPAQFKTQHKG